MAELHLSLKQLLDSFSEKSNAYKESLGAKKEYEEKMRELSAKDCIELEEYQEVADLYNSKELSEKTFNIQQELFSSTRQDIVNMLIPLQNTKLRFEYKSKDNKHVTYYVWLNYNREEPEASELLLQNLDIENSEPETIR